MTRHVSALRAGTAPGCEREPDRDRGAHRPADLQPGVCPLHHRDAGRAFHPRRGDAGGGGRHRLVRDARPMRVLAFAALAVSFSVQAGPIDEMLGQVSEKRIEANIRKLVSFGTRNSLSDTESTTRGIGAARRWIKTELERCCGRATRLQVAFDEHLVESGARVPEAHEVRERRRHASRRRRPRAATASTW